MRAVDSAAAEKRMLALPSTIQTTGCRLIVQVNVSGAITYPVKLPTTGHLDNYGREAKFRRIYRCKLGNRTHSSGTGLFVPAEDSQCP